LLLCQAEDMARGWESKAVESQIEAAENRSTNKTRTPLNPEQLKKERERDSVELSRTRVIQDLASATNPKYRELLKQSLDFLDEKLRSLDQAT
jgi:hypothetical protein